MRYLITGGAGFIGCNAAAGFRRDGHEVLCVDNFSRPRVEHNAAWLEDDVGVETRRLDLKDAEATRSLVAEWRPDVVLHFAAQVAVTTSVRDPRTDFEDNALATFNALEAVRLAAPQAVFLYTSTNKVYGGMEDVKVRLQGDRYEYVGLPGGCPEDRPLDFHSPYGCSKGAADQYVRDYARIYGLRTVVFRQSCIYGYRQFGLEDQGWVAWFTIRAAQGKPVTIFGDGKQVRDVLFVDDLVDVFRKAVDRIDEVSGRVYNIGGGPANTLSLLELIGILERQTGRSMEVGYDDWRPGDQRVFICDVGKAERELGWKPTTTAEEGVRLLHGWVAEHPSLFEGL
jgi:CDP-paratose 2-epimerase